METHLLCPAAGERAEGEITTRTHHAMFVPKNGNALGLKDLLPPPPFRLSGPIGCTSTGRKATTGGGALGVRLPAGVNAPPCCEQAGLHACGAAASDASF